MIKRLVLIFLLSFLAILFVNDFLYAEKIAIVYTGDSHSSLYPCRCPKKPNGGVARRATKIKELRGEYPNLLLLDNGNYFAGGVEDPDSQEVELNKKRTQVYLKSMEIMGYDALGIGKDEFNFEKGFLIDAIENTKLNFLSCNLELDGASPFIIKELGKTKIGIIAVSPSSKLNKDQDFSKTLKAVKNNLKKLRKQADIVIMLSQLHSGLDEKMLEKTGGIDIIVSSTMKTKYKENEKIGSTIYLKPYLWTRNLGVLELDVEDGEIKSFTTKKLEMERSIPDDPKIKAILPQCFHDKNCYKDKQQGHCQSAGQENAVCVYGEKIEVPLTVITPEDCKTCNLEAALDNLKKQIPGISVSKLSANDRKAKKLIKKFNINMLPAYLLGEEISKHDIFSNLIEKKIIEKKDDYYMVNPFVIGVSYLLDREFQQNKLDLFISLQDKASKNVLEITKKLLDKSKPEKDFRLHFLAMYNDDTGEFRAPHGLAEIEENKRTLCIMKKYPKKWWNYLLCRMENIQSTWWDDCAAKVGIDASSIKKCAKSKEADRLLKENIKLAEELKIYYGPLFLLDNKEIFGATAITTLEELEKTIK